MAANTQQRWERLVTIGVAEASDNDVELTWDRNYSNTGVLRAWQGTGLEPVFEVYFNWQGGTLTLQQPSHGGRIPTIDRTIMIFEPDEIADAAALIMRRTTGQEA